MSKDIKSPTPLSVMLGVGESFVVNDRDYIVKPIELIDVEEFMNGNLNLGSQIFSVADKNERKKIGRWLGGDKDKKGYCFDENGKSVSMEQAMKDGWNVVHLKEFLKKLCDLSG